MAVRSGDDVANVRGEVRELWPPEVRVERLQCVLLDEQRHSEGVDVRAVGRLADPRLSSSRACSVVDMEPGMMLRSRRHSGCLRAHSRRACGIPLGALRRSLRRVVGVICSFSTRGASARPTRSRPTRSSSPQPPDGATNATTTSAAPSSLPPSVRRVRARSACNPRQPCRSHRRPSGRPACAALGVPWLADLPRRRRLLVEAHALGRAALVFAATERA
jgi:hypothetical protein